MEYSVMIASAVIAQARLFPSFTLLQDPLWEIQSLFRQLAEPQRSATYASIMALNSFMMSSPFKEAFLTPSQ